MENDLPPSYNSVVKNQLRRRNQTGNDKIASESDASLAKQEDRVRVSRTSSIDHSTRADSLDEASEQSRSHDSRPSFWGRVKKALEDVALFVIQVLD